VALQLQALPNLILTHHRKLTSLERNLTTSVISFMPQFQEGPCLRLPIKKPRHQLNGTIQQPIDPYQFNSINNEVPYGSITRIPHKTSQKQRKGNYALKLII